MAYVQKTAGGEILVPNVIKGQAVNLPESQNFPVVNAASGEIAHYAQSATVDTANAAVEAALDGFKVWRKTRLVERRDLLLRAAKILESKVEDARKREVPETSCAPQWTDFDISRGSEFIQEIAGAAAGVMGSIPNSMEEGTMSLVFKEPVGPVLIIPPWNAPYILAFRGIAAALVAGCSVVLKASEICPWTHQLILEVLAEAGLPAGVINQVQAARKDAAAVTEALISNPGTRKIEFIGSAAVGRIIGQLGGKYLKPVLMELGDQSPAIVLDDADLKLAAANIAQGTLAHHGQICFGTERIIVQEKIKDAFSEELIQVFKNIPSAGSAVSIDGAQKAHNILQEAVDDGAKFLVGSNKFTGKASIEPSILINVNPKSRINKEEAFAPTASMFVVKNDEEAIALANNTDFGLSASVYTTNYKRGLYFARELEFGQVQLNNFTMRASGNTPVTGYKNSGWGSNNGAYGIEEFLFNKHVSLA